MPPTTQGEVQRYDRIVALGGTGSYLNDQELERIPLLLRPGGRAVVTFNLLDRRRAEGFLSADLHSIGNQVCCFYEKA